MILFRIFERVIVSEMKTQLLFQCHSLFMFLHMAMCYVNTPTGLGVGFPKKTTHKTWQENGDYFKERHRVYAIDRCRLVVSVSRAAGCNAEFSECLSFLSRLTK
jgi:hypothetical protein